MKLTSLLTIEAIPTKLGRLTTKDSHLTKFQVKRALDAEIETANKAFEIHSFEIATCYNPDGSRTEKNQTMQPPRDYLNYAQKAAGQVVKTPVAESSAVKDETETIVFRDIDKIIWHDGPPPSVGWYVASRYGNTNVLFFWNGSNWNWGMKADYLLKVSDDRFKAARLTRCDSGPLSPLIKWTHLPVHKKVLDKEERLFPKASLAPAVSGYDATWYSGNPPKIGWYEASTYQALGIYYFWNGSYWNEGGHDRGQLLCSDSLEFEKIRSSKSAYSPYWRKNPVPQALLNKETEFLQNQKQAPAQVDILDDAT